MKKVYLLLFILLCTTVVSAQGIYQLWGMTMDGGDDNAGTIFSISSTGNNFQQRKQFSINNPGTYPQLTSLAQFNGKLYGMTQSGGNSSSGLIFEWDPNNNQYTKKIAFNGFNGSGPLGSLVLNGNKFYGMTEYGGDNAIGVIFEWDPATNIYTKKFDFIDNGFDGHNGYRPAGDLTAYAGKFYGMTAYGGNNDNGVIFEWNPATNTYTKKFEFNGTNGNRPFGNLTMINNKFYGMTSQGGINGEGVIFEWDPATNIYTKKIDFNGSNGAYPYGSLTIKGNKFIGLTQQGGNSDDGVLFEWDPSNNQIIKKIDFEEPTGYWPSGNLAMDNGKYYGMTFRGGNDDVGVIFEWDPIANTYSKKVDLTSVNGSFPNGSLTVCNGKFYGMTDQGGTYGKGVIFQWDQAENQYNKKIDLNDVGKGINPAGTLRQLGGKLYGMTNSGGVNNAGVIFEWDQAAGQYTKKIDLSNATGSKPSGSLAFSNGKFYGMTKTGGDNGDGVIFEWDPAANTYTKKIDLLYDNGSAPQGNLTLNNGKFYGMTNIGGANGGGVIFEWDPVTNNYVDKINLTNSGGNKPSGSLSFYNGKFYGMTNKGGTGNSNGGVIFEWDPATNTYTKKINLNSTTGNNPYGSLTLSDSKFYGMTSSGGTNNAGVIFEWDPATNMYTKKFEFFNSDASSPFGNLSLSAGKFYGMTRNGGSNNGGVVFEWDPISNVYTKKADLDQYSGGAFPGIVNDFDLIPAPVAKGVPGTCTSFAAITIDNNNDNEWVPIVDNAGDAVAEIKANGNNLGIVSTSMFINDVAVREDGANRLYLDRNLTITPQFPLAPGSSVDIRLYIKNSEYLALKNAVNSNGQPSGINSINEIGIYKNNDGCSSAVGFIANPVSTVAATWESDYVLSGKLSSFSTFYFASTEQGGPLPVTNLEFNGRLLNKDADIRWKTTDEFNTRSFDLERSIDGRAYNVISNTTAANRPGVHQYSYIDNNIESLNVPVVYYRLKQVDVDGKFKYSGIVALSIKKATIVIIYPNPVAEKASITISVGKPEKVQLRLVDNMGRVVKQQQLNLSANSTSLSLDVSDLPKAVYYLELKGDTVNEHKQLIKQ